jgi:tetratricopeptide (TPR) repeat protein
MAVAFGLASCNKFLDEMPDNRAEVDDEKKVQTILVEAYPQSDYIQVNELMSDNVDRYMANNPNTTRYFDQVYTWSDITETNNESVDNLWSNCYTAIANANLALEGIDRMGGATTKTLQEARAEGLICRAYAHFLLVNTFCMAYSSQTAAVNMGIPYIEAPETILDPKHERGTVAEVYAKIDRDLQEALPMVGSSYMTVPKYHFNLKAAYAFAARFYLYYEKWEQAVKYATLCLGSNPTTLLRDYATLGNLGSDYDVVTNHFIDTGVNANLLLMTTYGNLGYLFGNYSTGKKYSHVDYICDNETMNANNVWGSGGFRYRVRSYNSVTSNYNIFWRFPRMFEYTDPVAGTGYYRTVYPALTTDECLLNRAEAYVMLGQYDKAAADLTMWLTNITTVTGSLTPEYITSFYNSKPYSYSDADRLLSTVKKHLHPGFAIDAEGSTQECMLQCVLGFRRIETMPMGIRWWDIKRYGIEIPRRTINASGNPESIEDWLTVDDPRRAAQIPQKVRDAGLTPNPRY